MVIKEVHIDEMRTAKELAKKYPNCGMTASQIGYACSIGVVECYRPKNGSIWYLTEESFQRLIKIRHETARLKIITY